MTRWLGALVIGAALLGGCSAAASPTPLAPTPPRDLTAAESAWCTNHTGGPGDDMHQVEDMALQLNLIPGAKTRDDVFGRWAGHGPGNPDPTNTIACVAAYAAYGSATPGPS